MTIVALPSHVGKCLVQVKVDIERLAAQRAEQVVHIVRSLHSAEHPGHAFRVR